MDVISSYFNTAQNVLTRYGMTTYLCLGNIGLFFNFNIFSQRAHRRNPSSLYILSMTICHFCCLNFGTIPFIYALNHPDPLTNSLILCKLQFYFRHSPYQMVRSFMILTCIDRYVSSNNEHRFRSFSQYRTAIRLILFTVLFWFLVCLFIPVLLSIEEGVCGMFNNLQALFYSIYLLIFAGIIPPLAMTITSVLIICNLKKIRMRVQPLGTPANGGLIRKRDRDFIRMILVEIMIYVITSVPFVFIVVYTTIIQLELNDYTYYQWQLFLIYLTRSFLVYLNNSLPFWIYLIMSKSFRNEFKDLITKWYLFIKKINEINFCFLCK